MITNDEVFMAVDRGLMTMTEARHALRITKPRDDTENLRTIQKIAVNALPADGGAIMWRVALEEIDQLCTALLHPQAA